MSRALPSAALLLLLLSACDAAPPAPEKPRAKPTMAATAAPANAIAPPADPAARLAAAVRAVPANSAGRFAFEGDDRLIDTPFGPVLLRHGKVPDAGHVDSGVVAAYYLRSQGTGFALVKAYPEAAVSGSFGDLASWSVSDAFAALPTLVVEGGGTWQGCTIAQTDLVELRPQGPVQVASFVTTFDTEGTGAQDTQSLEGNVADIVRDRGFTVRYKGTGSFSERYVRRGDRYALQGGESRISGC